MKFFSSSSIGIGLLLVIPIFLTSCSKDQLYEVKGTVVDVNNTPVVNAKIQIFNTSEDWLTGRNVVTTLTSDVIGEFKSAKVFEKGQYYMFIEKYDTSNWNINEVEQGVYPQINIPIEDASTHVIEYNNISLLANTNWKLTNTLREYKKTNMSAIEWRSTWSSARPCIRDNSLHFGKDLSFRMSEGNVVCSGKTENTLGTFVPPIIFSSMSCQNLIHTSQKVKTFTYDGLDNLSSKNAEIFVSCEQSVGQLYILYDVSANQKGLEVYSKY